MMIGDGDFFLHSASSIGFDEVRCERPEDRVTFVRADALKMIFVVACALHIAERWFLIAGLTLLDVTLDQKW